MLNTTSLRTAISIICLLTITGIASADTKIKSRQTSNGQTYENTSYIKGKRQRSETNNGQMVVIQQCDLRRNLQIMPAAKAYMIQPYDEPSATTSTTTNNTSQPTAVKKGGRCHLDRHDQRHGRAQTDVWLHRASHHHDDGCKVVS